MLQLSFPLLLASQSPRRQELIKMLGLDFRLISSSYQEEPFTNQVDILDFPSYLCKKKAEYINEYQENHIAISADTLVFCCDSILPKPIDIQQAKEFLRLLSNNSHEVITGVTLRFNNIYYSFSDKTEVQFEEISADEIDYYVSNYKVLDKAGGYGAQDWLGLAKIKSLVGSYFNVMGLPTHLLYKNLMEFNSSINS